MKKFLILLFVLTACANNGDEPPQIASNGEPAYEMMSAKSQIVGRPTLVKLGVQPLKIDEARQYMNEMLDSLTPDLDKTNITYQMAGHDIILTIQSHLIIKDGSINPDIKPQLKGFAKTFVKYNRTYIEFRGHTSSIGDSKSNKRQSLKEAREVADYFLDKGILPERVFINGQGESMWIADNTTREGQLLNHRIEIRISPLI